MGNVAYWTPQFHQHQLNGQEDIDKNGQLDLYISMVNVVCQLMLSLPVKYQSPIIDPRHKPDHLLMQVK